MKDLLTTVGELAGGGLVAYGCYRYAHPAGYISGGVFLIVVSWLADR